MIIPCGTLAPAALVPVTLPSHQGLYLEETANPVSHLHVALAPQPDKRTGRMDQLKTQGTSCKDSKGSLQRAAICQILIILSDVVKYPISTSPVYCSK
ncbi:hypothetical protein JD844_015586 [Phrynosoma platyrhinos]|uniref:Uncharacterized protein n=1 Tax=Phrynosoma platyrhinos TaxID=52577 RepID=A0ABQ7SJD5_PHRPL|nr:hypothetical protein JD844_015586 [Phrynosoma platyrhinos]